MDTQTPQTAAVPPLLPPLPPSIVPEVPAPQFPAATDVLAPLPEQPLAPEVAAPTPELTPVAPATPEVLPQNTNSVQSPQAVGLPPLPAQANLPPIDKQVLTAEFPSSGKKKGKKILLVLVLLLVLTGLGFGGVTAYSSLKTKFNPLVSPLLEDFLFTPGQQITSRINYLIDISVPGAISELRDLNIPVDTDYEEKEMAYYKKNIAPKITGLGTNFDSSVTYESNAPLSGVLGINSEAGKIDQTFISELMSTKNVTVLVSGQEFVDITNRAEPKLKGTTAIQLQLPSSQISTTLDTLNVKDQFYLMLKSFPENDYLDFSYIMNKWVLFDNSDLKRAQEEANAGVEKTPIEFKKDTYVKVKEILAVNEFTSRIKAAPYETINGVKSKCYSIALDTASTKEIADAMSRKTDELNGKKSAISSEIASEIADTSTATTNTTICFADGKMVPNKIVSTSNVVTETSQTRQTTSISFSGLSKEISFALPTADVLKSKEIPMDKLLKPAALVLFGGLSGDNASYRNALRTRDIAVISKALALYFNDYNDKTTDIKNIPTCPKMAPIIIQAKGTIPKGSVNLYPLVAKEYLESTLMDPSNTSMSKDTGYTMCIVPGNLPPTYKVAAPNAEDGKVIEL